MGTSSVATLGRPHLVAPGDTKVICRAPSYTGRRTVLTRADGITLSGNNTALPVPPLAVVANEE
jgi:hypothetical protein